MARGDALGLQPGLSWTLHHYGLPGAAWVSAAARIVFRGLAVPVYLCRALRFSPLRFLFSIYTRPVLTALPVWAAAWFWCARTGWGSGWAQLIVAAGAINAVYLGAAYFTTLGSPHRPVVFSSGARS